MAVSDPQSRTFVGMNFVYECVAIDIILSSAGYGNVVRVIIEIRKEWGVQWGPIATWKRFSAAAAVDRPCCGFNKQNNICIPFIMVLNSLGSSDFIVINC